MSSKLVKIALAAFLALMHAAAPAEDIDLFTAAPGAGANVLIMLDNTSNWNANDQHWPGGIKQGQAELAALKQVINSLAPDGVDSALNVGLMMLTNVSASPAGAYVRSAMKPMTAANRDDFSLLLDTIYANFSNPSEMVGSSMDYDRAMFEIFKYFGGYTSPANATTNVAGTPVNSTHFGALRYAEADPKTDPAAFVDPITKLTYKPASMSDDSCPRKNYLIFIGNGFPDATNAEGATLLPNVGGNTTQIYNESPTNKNRFTDEWARFLYTTDVSSLPGKQNVITYTINVYNAKPSAEQGRLLTSMALVGGGTPFVATSAAAISSALKTIFSEIQSVNSAFASASLPVSVNAQGTYLNQIFVGMFRPEVQPRWYGNLKQYQFVPQFDASGSIVGLKTADKNGVPIVSPLTGFVTPCAESFWSTAVDPYWPNDYLGNCLESDVRYDSPDGEIVEKGGAAQKLRAVSGLSGAAARNVKTMSGGTLADFSTSTASISDLGLATGDTAGQTALVNWIRGQNVDDELSKGTSVMRPSVHGDVVHSRPLAIDYGGTTGVVVFYGGNDGMLRAINGNQEDAIPGGFVAGAELWSFVAPEHYAKFNRLKTNSPAISFPSVDPSTTPAPAPKGYFFDGPIGVYSSGSTKWIYPTMRRGGNAVYAFDVSNPTSPALKWKRDGSQLTNIGQTWSEPKVVKVAGYPSLASTTKSPVIIMGGGYDTCEDLDAAPNTTCATPKGNRVFVLDAEYGTLLQTFSTDRSVAADVAVRDSNGDGLVDVAYVVDTGANIYRINIGQATPADWTFTKIAVLGCGTAASCDRKFLHAPEVVVTAAYNAVLVGSGNRERPLLANNATLVDNAFFMIKDDATVSSPAVITTSELLAMDPNLEPTTAQLDELALSTNKGWYLAFGTPHSDPDLDHDKEQVVTSATVFAGVAYFSTHTPTAPTACGANLGKARGYAVNFLDASSRDIDSKYSEFAGGGLAPSPVTGIVEIAVTDSEGLTSTIKVPFVIGGKPPSGEIGSGIGGAMAEISVSPVRSRVYWYIQQ